MLVTALVIAGIVIWPTTSNCLNAGGTFGSCLQQSLAERGLAPAPEPEAIVSAEPEIVAEPETAPTDVAGGDAESTLSPVIDARVEADGSTILAGTVDPNIDVHLFFNGVEVGQTTSDSVGDWIYIPDEPLPMGGVAITLGTGVEGEEITQSADALAVVVDGESQPTVMAAAPDELADLIEELTGTPPELGGGAEQPMETAALDPDDTPDMSESETAIPDADLLTPAPEMEAEQPAVEQPEAAAEEPATEAPVAEEPVAEAPAAEEPAAEAPVAEETPEIVEQGDEPVDAKAPVSAETPEAPGGEEPSASEQTADPATAEDEPMQMAAVEPDQTVPDTSVEPVLPTVSVEPTIDAVEIDPDGSYIAGAGEDGMIIRLFVDDEFVGESPIEGGRWLVETDEALTEPNQRIRAEMMAPNDLVTAEAEINFVIDRPENAGPAADADLILPTDQLAPIALPSEAPMVVADAPAAEVATPAAPDAAQDTFLPDDSLSEMTLPAEAPTIAIAEPAPEMAAPEEVLATQLDDTPDVEVAETQPEAAFTLPEDQLAPIELPTEAPMVATTDEPETPAVASADDTLILPEDQLAPIALPTQAPLVAAPADTPTPMDVAEAAEDEIVLSDDQLGPIALPTQAPLVAVPADTPTPMDVAEVSEDEIVLSDDQLAPVELPTEAPLVAVPVAPVADAPAMEPDAPEMVADAEPLILPADQLPAIELPPDAPLVAQTPDVPAIEAETSAPEMMDEEVPEMEVAEVAPNTLPADQLPAIELPIEAPAVAKPEPTEMANEPVDVAEAPTPAPARARLPADQLPAIALPTEAPPIVIGETSPVEQHEAAEPDVPTLVATPVGDPVEGRFASGKVIIRRGDNLWTIARRVYGRGIQYTRIFDANREKINNPDLIFPGQVFDLPETALQ